MKVKKKISFNGTNFLTVPLEHCFSLGILIRHLADHGFASFNRPDSASRNIYPAEA